LLLGAPLAVGCATGKAKPGELPRVMGSPLGLAFGCVAGRVRSLAESSGVLGPGWLALGAARPRPAGPLYRPSGAPGAAAGASAGAAGAPCWPLAASGRAVPPAALGRLTAAARTWAFGRDIRSSAVSRRR
jgi:hypothetical protein